MESSHSEIAPSFAETLCLCAGLAALAASLCIWIVYFAEGLHYSSIVSSQREIAWLWLRYAVGFAVPALVSHGLARLIAPRASRRLVSIAVSIGCCAPVLAGVAATRPELVTPGIIVSALVGGAIAIPFLSLAAKPERRHIGRVVAALALAAPVSLTALNSWIWLWPTGMNALGGKLMTAATSAGAALLVAPFLAVMRLRRSRERIRGLAVVALVFGAVLELTIALPRESVARAAATHTAESASAPPILLIVIDTLRADAIRRDLRATPRLAALAEESIVFTRAISASTWTTPAFASILTSTHPSQHRAGSLDEQFGFKQALIERLPTLSTVLGARGYWTGAVLSNAYLGRRFGLDRGFDAYENLLAVEWGHPLLVGLSNLGLWKIPSFVRAPKQVERVLELVRRGSGSGRPFFVLAHFMDPHQPYRQANGRAEPTASRAQRYFNEVAYLDEHLGTLLDELRREGLYDDLLIAVTADHGEELEEDRGQGDYGHGHSVFEEVLHVPLMLKLPHGARAGEHRNELVSMLDVAPTLLAAAGLEPLPEFRGSSLLASAGELAQRTIFSERTLYGPERKAAIRGNYKVVLELGSDSDAQLQAFDLDADPAETRPLDPNLGAFRSLTDSLQAFAALDHASGDGRAVDVDERFRQRLEALGYLQ